MPPPILIVALLLLPAAGAGLCALLPSARSVFFAILGCVAGMASLSVALAAHVHLDGPAHTAWNWLMVDSLSTFNLLIMTLVFLMSSAAAQRYFRGDDALPPALARRFGALWLGSFSGWNLVLLSNSVGLMWVGMEAATLLTAFLICIHRTRESLEATWKYLVICSVGIAFAFMGTLLVAASAHSSHLSPSDSLLWTRLVAVSSRLNPDTIKVGFVFLIVGYGTKAGLAPMHSWLPDAHSQAPAPVSAVFSGFMLSASLYCIMRFVPLVEASTGNSGWCRRFLILFGVISIVVSAAFIVFQKDLKRLLAYSSVEHMGIIALGVGLGGLGTFAALFHTLNHSIGKTLAFFCAGRLGQMYGTHDMTRLAGTVKAAPVCGAGLFWAFLALLGMAPFAIFMSELQILKAAVDESAWWPFALFLLGTGIVFVGALRHAISMAWKEPGKPLTPEKAGWEDVVLVAVPLAVLVVLGVWMPDLLKDMLWRAARTVTGGAPM